jgi:hypothetical protein
MKLMIGSTEGKVRIRTADEFGSAAMKVASSQPTRLRLFVVLDGIGLKFRGEM